MIRAEKWACIKLRWWLRTNVNTPALALLDAARARWVCNARQRAIMIFVSNNHLALHARPFSARKKSAIHSLSGILPIITLVNL